MYALFIFILINNLIGMVPYSFASTSHFILTFSLSFTVVLGATVLGFKEHGLKFFSLFVPAGCPLGLLPLLRSEEHTSELQSHVNLVCRLLLEKKNARFSHVAARPGQPFLPFLPP